MSRDLGTTLVALKVCRWCGDRFFGTDAARFRECPKDGTPLTDLTLLRARQVSDDIHRRIEGLVRYRPETTWADGRELPCMEESLDGDYVERAEVLRLLREMFGGPIPGHSAGHDTPIKGA